MLFDDEDEPGAREPLGNQRDVVDSDADRIVVNAEAGTGKTTTMRMTIQRAIREDRVDPDDVLVLTFANKAAHEIENRLARTMPEQGHDVDADTYHSFCHSLVQDYAYHLGLPPDFVVVTEERRKSVVQAILDEMEYEFVEPIDPATGIDDGTLGGDLLDFISEMKRRGFDPAEVRSHLPASGTIRSLFEAVRRLEAAAKRAFEVGRDLDDSAARRTIDDGTDEFREAVTAVLADLEDVPTTPTDERVVTEVREFLATWLVSIGHIEAWVDEEQPTGNQVYVPAMLFGGGYPAYLEPPKQTLFGRLEAYVESLGKAFVFVDGYEAYERHLAHELQAVDFDDLITRATYLLTESPYSDEILSRWESVFCDEFQDTNRRQFDLVDALAAEGDLFVIGDRHQAIYEWRGASPDNIGDVDDVFDDVVSFDLDLNFRSPQGILDFAANLPNERDRLSTSSDESIERTRMTADEGERDRCVLEVENEPGTDTETTAERVAVATSRLLTGQLPDVDAYDPEDVAVLVRKRHQAEAIADAFDAESIPCALADRTGSDTAHGVRTVLAYLKVLVDPNDDVPLNRVLLHFYRVPRSDLARLNREERSTWVALQDDDLDQYGATDRLERARNDVRALRAKRETSSISELYQELTDTTKFEWFLGETDRQDLAHLERLITVFDEDAPIQSTLTESFIEHVELQESITRPEGGQLDTAEKAENAVNVMTVFQAKGLDFPVVVLPFLSDDEWLQSPANYRRGMFEFDLFGETLEGTVTNPLHYDYAQRDLPEEHRILHVGVTRAAERLVLVGNEPDRRDVTVEDLDRFLGNTIDWSTGGPRMRIWDAVTEAYDATRERRQANVSDVTDLVDAGIDETPENLTFYGDTTDVESAIDDVLAAARDLRDGDLSPKSPATIGVASELGDLDRDRTIGHEHSYSSLDVFGDCPRRHALDYVIGAIADPPGHVSTPAEGTRAPSQRKVGDLFHHVAEAAYWRDYADDRSAWNRACGRIASVHDYDEDVVAAARTCVDRYFDSEVVADDWTLTAVEVPFELDTAVLDFDVDVDATVTGQIDAIYEDADGHLIVVDYKTTADERRLRDSYQLALYTLAADYHYDFTPWKAGYLVLGTPDPRLLLFDESDLRSLVDPLAADLEAVETATLAEQYDSPDPGPYCRHCDHRSLGCAPDRFDPS